MSHPQRLAIAGATGVVGHQALDALLADSACGTVVAVGRRAPTSTIIGADAKLHSVHPELTNVDAIAAAIAQNVEGDLDGAICTLGTTMKTAGSKEAFRRVDYDAVVAFATAARARGAKRLVLISSLGAKATSANFYLQVKGQAEAAVSKLGFDGVAILRPSVLDDGGRRGERRLGERVGISVMRGVAAVIGRHHKMAPIGVDVVGRAAARLALSMEVGVQIIESDLIHALGA